MRVVQVPTTGYDAFDIGLAFVGGVLLAFGTCLGSWWWLLAVLGGILAGYAALPGTAEMK